VNNTALDFEIRRIGRQMPRRRGQEGWVRREWKSWIGYAYCYERAADGTEKRRVKQHLIGACEEMTKAEAKTAHLKWVADLGKAPEPEPLPAQPAPVAPKFFKDWEKYADLKVASGAWGKHHESTLRAVMKTQVLPVLGDRILSSLQVDDLMAPLLNMKRTGRNKYYLHHATQTIRNVMDYAEENSWIAHNPARSKFYRKPECPDAEVKAIGQTQFGNQIIWELRKQENLKVLVAVAVSGIAGARRQESWVLRWDDITATHIRIDEAWKLYEPAERRIGPPKTGKTRFVPIGAGVYDLLMEWKAKISPKDDSEFIFPSNSPHGWPENLDNFLRRQLKPFGQKVGFPNLTFRTLRKTAASMFGNDVKSAQAHLGHARAAQHQGPGGAAVARTVDAGTGGAVDSREHHVGIRGTDGNPADARASAGEARRAERADERAGKLRPRCSAIGGFQNARSITTITRIILLTGSDIDDVGIGWRERDRAGGKRGLVVGDRLPLDAAVGGLPDTSAGSAEIDDVGITRVHRECGYAAGGVRRARAGIGVFRKNVRGPGADEHPGGSCGVRRCLPLRLGHAPHFVKSAETRGRGVAAPRRGPHPVELLLPFQAVLSARRAEGGFIGAGLGVQWSEREES
jgi:integrase